MSDDFNFEDAVVEENTVQLEATPVVKEEDIKVENAVMSKSAKQKAKPKVAEKQEPVVKDDKVALFSEKNLHSGELGSLKLGYNIVSAEKAEKWLKHKAVRKATPQEVASAYGK